MTDMVYLGGFDGKSAGKSAVVEVWFVLSYYKSRENNRERMRRHAVY
jgi:hypothetical protein